MPDRLNALYERLKAQQRALLLCRWPSMRECRPGAPFARSAALKNVIAAVEAIAAAEARQKRRSVEAADRGAPGWGPSDPDANGRARRYRGGSAASRIER